MFTIFGANGRTGSVVAKTLLERGQKVRVALRPGKNGDAWLKRGAEVVTADLQDADSIAKALSGAAGAYALMPPDPTASALLLRSRKLVDTFAQALEKSPVPHIAFLSSVAAQHPSAGAGAGGRSRYAEQRLSQTKSVFSFVRAACFMGNFAVYAPLIHAQGMFPVFGGGEFYKFPMVAPEDIGQVAARALLEPVSSQRIIELAGPEDYSFADVAREISTVLGREVRATPLPIEDMVDVLMRTGLSRDIADLFREMIEAIGKGLMTFEGKVPLTRGNVTLKTMMERLFAK